MNEEPLDTPPSGLDLREIYYAFFRQKWKIILLSLTGILAAAILYVVRPPAYQSVAKFLVKNLEVEAIGHSSTIRVAFHHPDAEIVQPVLKGLIDGYQKKHVEVHRSAGVVEEDLTKKTDELRGKLAKVEEELRGWMDKA